MPIKFEASGMYLGSYQESNSVVAARLGISSAEILHKSGIQARYKELELSAAQMSVRAIEEAMIRGNFNLSDVDGIIVAGFSNDCIFPNLTSQIAQILQWNVKTALDVQMNCAGFQSALNVAHDKLAANMNLKRLAVVGVAKQTPYLDPNDINTAYFFSDAASCVIVSKDGEGYQPGLTRLITNNINSVRLRGGGSAYREYDPNSKLAFYEHAGMAVWKETIVQIPRIIRDLVEDRSWTLEEVDYVLMHQANLRLIEFIMGRLRLPMTKTLTTVNAIGNTADGSLGTVIYQGFNRKVFEKPLKMVLVSVGAGFIYEAGTYEVLS